MLAVIWVSRVLRVTCADRMGVWWVI